MKTRKGKEGIDLGLAVSALSLKPGECRSYGELAAFCGVHRSAIQHIELKAMKKLRRALDPLRAQGEL